ncbi:MAG: penicillin-binding protein 2 [bacterium]|nr:penicillin-binding protein 2 [bacterium]
MRGAELGGAGRRVALMRAIFLALFVVLAGRAAHLTVVTERGEMRARGQLEGVMVLPATRGLIVDRNGVELALTVRTPSIYVLPRDFDGNPKSLHALARALGTKPAALRERLSQRDRFTFVGRWVGEDVAARIEALELPGVGLVMEPRRAYPADQLAGSLLGFSNIDGEGVRGVEEMEDEWLRGSPLRTSVERDARGQLMAQTRVAPVSTQGGDVALTIDMTMQAEAETALREAVKKTGARGGCVITLDPRTGEILALAEAPGFNPNRFRKLDYDDTRSAAFQDAVEPGSVLKAFLVAAALETGAIGLDQRLDTGDGTLAIPGKTIRDHRPYGVLDPAGVLRFSSNVGSVMIADLVGAKAHHSALRRFGFGKKTGSGFPSESNGLLRPWKQWKAIDHATVAYGQGVGVTSIQLASAMATLAGDGQWRMPRIVSARRRPDGEWQPIEPEAPRRVVREEVAANVMKMLESVVSAEGTGRKAALAKLAVAGKTGTAQKLDVERGVYSKTRYAAWFMGAAPARDSKLVIVTMLDEPKGLAHGGGDVAAPLFAKVAAGQLAHLGILTKPEPIPAPPREVKLAAKTPKAAKKKSVKVATAKKAKKTQPAKKTTQQPKTKPAEQQRAPARLAKTPAPTPAVSSPPPGAVPPLFVPDFRGETIDAVRAIAKRERIRLEVRGRGLAVDQHPTPGTVVAGSDRDVWVAFSGGGRGR